MADPRRSCPHPPFCLTGMRKYKGMQRQRGEVTPLPSLRLKRLVWPKGFPSARQARPECPGLGRGAMLSNGTRTMKTDPSANTRPDRNSNTVITTIQPSWYGVIDPGRPKRKSRLRPNSLVRLLCNDRSQGAHR